jgi:hypothetical protein
MDREADKTETEENKPESESQSIPLSGSRAKQLQGGWIR